MANKNLFNSIKLTRPKRNVFDLTHDVKMTLDMGNLCPIMALECVPGDKFQLSCESLLRFAPLVSPVMHRMDVTMHYFFVPNRIVWPNWEKFIVGESAANPHPTLTLGNDMLPKLADYLGLPQMGEGQERVVSALPFAAYQCIYNEYYRDQNLISEVDYKLVNGSNDANKAVLGTLRKRAWEHDYFTAALPWAQKGASVDIPIGSGIVEPIATNIPGVWRDAPGGLTAGTGNIESVAGQATIDESGIDQAVYYDPNGSLGVEMESTTINDLRRAFRLQEWLEKNARAGTRYVESILAHFGVKSSDKRMQRPEYITGTKSPVVISEVLNTAGEMDGLAQGNMAGHGISVTSGQYGSYFCEEHGYIIGIMSVLPKTAYQQGIPRHFLKYTDHMEYFWPEFANIGEQEVYNKELYAAHANPDDVFGYVPRYAEYKYMPSRVAGDFKNNLDYWHLGRIFDSPPALNQDFVECNPDKRIFAVTTPSDNSLYAHVLNKVKAIRPMPKFGTPSF